jgi:acylphosphatase
MFSSFSSLVPTQDYFPFPSKFPSKLTSNSTDDFQKTDKTSSLNNSSRFEGAVNLCLSIIVSGRVQGVGFRYFTKNKAEERGITGWVRNLIDGKVEVLACGPESDLEQFMLVLKEGSLGSRVSEVHSQWLPQKEDLINFTIRY